MDWLPPWSVAQEILLSLILPAFAAAAGLLAVVCAATRSQTIRMIGAAAALGAGLAAGNVRAGLLPWWSAEQGWPALFPATLAAVIGGVIAALVSARRHWSLELALRLITAAGCSFWLTEAFPPLSGRRTAMLMFAGMVLNWEGLLLTTSRCSRRGTLPALAILWGGAAATVLIFAHSARFFDMAVLLTAVLCGIGLVAALWNLELAALFGAPAIFFPALMLAGAANTYSEVPLAAFALTAFAPCMLWILLVRPIRLWQERALTVAAVVALLIPCAAAVVMAARTETLEFDE